MKASYDVSEVVRQFMRGTCEQRNELIRTFSGEVAHNMEVRRLLSEIGHEGVENQLTPINCIALGLMYGLTVGVILEQERVARERKIVS